jgi:large subunit ribosomal protein L23
MAALFDFLKRKEETQKSQSKKQPAKKAEKVSVSKEVTPKTQVKPAVTAKPTTSGKHFSYYIIKEPHISEKANYIGQQNKYVFKVYERSNKPEIKKAVEGLYGVNVLAVNVLKSPKKKRRLGKTEGFKKGFSKAIVTLQEGQKIEVF